MSHFYKLLISPFPLPFLFAVFYEALTALPHMWAAANSSVTGTYLAVWSVANQQPLSQHCPFLNNWHFHKERIPNVTNGTVMNLNLPCLAVHRAAVGMGTRQCHHTCSSEAPSTRSLGASLGVTYSKVWAMWKDQESALISSAWTPGFQERNQGQPLGICAFQYLHISWFWFPGSWERSAIPTAAKSVFICDS